MTRFMVARRFLIAGALILLGIAVVGLRSCQLSPAKPSRLPVPGPAPPNAPTTLADFAEVDRNVWSERPVWEEDGGAALEASPPAKKFWERFRSNYPFHMQAAAEAERTGFLIRGTLVLIQDQKRLFPYGYPFDFVPNIHHQYALIFQRPT